MERLEATNVEFVQDTTAHGANRHGGVRLNRWRLFASVFLLLAVAGLAFTFLRAPVYRAAATVLTVKPKAVDARSEEADREHVAIQGRALLSEELLYEVGQTLAQDAAVDATSVDALRRLFVVYPVPETNLVELRADGVDPEFLQRAVNAWADGYERLRQRQIAASKDSTTAELEDAQDRLQETITARQSALAAFRERHNIVSLENAENQAPAKLRGINSSLSRAREKLIEARAKLESARSAIAEGKTVMPRDQRGELAAKQVEAERLRDRLESLKERYTPAYFERDPALRALPQELQELQVEVRRLKALGQRQVIDEMNQDVEAAAVSVRALEQELADHRASSQQFSEIFQQHQALQDELERIQALHADNAERLSKIHATNLLKYPPMQLVERADLPTDPIYPHYRRDAAISLGVAFAAALFVTWLVEYLSGTPQDDRSLQTTGVRIYPGGSAALPHPGAAIGALTMPPAVERLTGPNLPEELTLEEIAALLDAANPIAAACAALLLSGVAPRELALLKHAHYEDLSLERLQVPGEGARTLALTAGVVARLEVCKAAHDRYPEQVGGAELDDLLIVAATDAGHAEPGRVTGERLWLAYVLFLVRQGARLSDLIERTGPLTTSMLAVLASYSPPGVNRPLSEVDIGFPGL